MRNRFLSVAVLLLALLVSAWGNVVAAAMCPHMRQDHACCQAQAAHGSASHEMMGDMQMGDMPVSPIADQRIEPHAFSQPGEACAHCMAHSQVPPAPVRLGAVNASNHGVHATLPATSSHPGSFVPSIVATITSRQHAPPESSAARHVLISVFRI
ncbi:MAG: hypothetical protein LC754_07515 [Acidobacteria bacterium]|nr:hypothetical protein [Acidobacteriota bacterium]